MKKTQYMTIGIFISLLAIVGLTHKLPVQESKPQSKLCAGLGYQTDRCECDAKKKCTGCTCDRCTADQKCVCITAVRKTAGLIKGKINVVKTKVKTTGPKSYKDVVFFLESVKKERYPVPSQHRVMDQRGLVFVPHVMAVQKGTTLDFLNNDNVEHNIFCIDDCCKILEEKPGKKPKFMDLGSWGQGKARSYTFNIPGEAVLLCKLHPEMAAYIMIVDTPYFTVAHIDEKTQTAEYIIKNIPPGEYILKAWNKKCVSLAQKVTIKEKETAEVNIEIARKKRRR